MLFKSVIDFIVKLTPLTQGLRVGAAHFYKYKIYLNTHIYYYTLKLYNIRQTVLTS
jgi:hypothetical protein